MNIKVQRYAHGKDSTGGILFVNGKFFGYTLEDEYRKVKVPGETRIPEGIYPIKLRDAGGMNKRYAKKYGFHRGMLHLQDVPGFEWIYIHPGNTDDHTEGCILVGFSANQKKLEGTIGRSVDAYSDLYNLILRAIDRGEDITMEVT